MDRILTTHVGSLIRPPRIKDDLFAKELGQEIDEKKFVAALKDAVDNVVASQAALGLDIVNDGEYGKANWVRYFYGRVSGIEPRRIPFDAEEILSAIPPGLREMMPRLPDVIRREGFVDFDPYLELVKFLTFYPNSGTRRVSGDGTGWFCTGPIKYDPAEVEWQLSNLKAAMRGKDIEGGFMTAVSPASLFWIVNEYYDSEEEFIFAAADALAEEYRSIVNAGIYLQVDDAFLWHKYTAIMASGGTPQDYERWAIPRIEALNSALDGIPQDRIRYHVCSGSAHGPKMLDPSLRVILPFAMKVKWGALLFEQGNARHEHEWAIWKEIDLPEDRVVVPGVITHQTEMVEHPELIAERLVRMADIVGRERVVAGADCGFAQSALARRVDPWTQWAKLQALAQGAGDRFEDPVATMMWPEL